MKIWIVVIDDELEGLRCKPFLNKAAAHDYATRWLESLWGPRMPNDEMPQDWQTAFDQMKHETRTMDFLNIEEHETDG